MKTTIKNDRTPTLLPTNNGPTEAEAIVITRPRMVSAHFLLEGTGRLCVNRFSSKAQAMIKERQEAGSQGKKGKNREPKDFKKLYELAFHRSTEGWFGINASGIRNGLISACRLVGFKMTLAKLSLFCLADGYGTDGTPLVQIIKGEPHYSEMPTRNATGVIDLRPRPIWEKGWRIRPHVRWDIDQFSGQDVANLFWRFGEQVGLCEGRADSRASNGIGFGHFNLINEEEVIKTAKRI